MYKLVTNLNKRRGLAKKNKKNFETKTRWKRTMFMKTREFYNWSNSGFDLF